MASAVWTFGLVDVLGNSLSASGLALAAQRKLTFQQGAPNACTFQLPVTSQEAQQIAIGQTYVKAYRAPVLSVGLTGPVLGPKVLRFYGPVWVDQIPAGADTVGVTAYDPTVYLTKRETTLQASGDQGALLKTMIDATQTTDGELGIRTSAANITTSATVTVDLLSQSPMISTMVQQFSGQLDGCEMYAVPIDNLPSAKMCDVYMTPQRGSVRAGVVFGYGDGTYDNALIGRVRNMDNLENDVTGFSDTINYRAVDLTAVGAVRRLKGFASFTGETSAAKLQARTLGRLTDRYSPAAIAEYEAKPTSRAPVLFDDYDIGDTVTLDYRRGIEFTVQQRVLSAEVDVSDVGVEAASTIRFRAA